MLKSIVIPDFEILAQPDDITCGPTCLQAVYNYFRDPVSLSTVINETRQLNDGGTLAVILGNHALARNYHATLFTFNLVVFDPTWFGRERSQLILLLREQMRHKRGKKLQFASKAYIEFLERGGVIRFEEMTKGLLLRHLEEKSPVLAGLSATYLYNTPREIPETNSYDHIKGLPSGHFVVINGYDDEADQFMLADPLKPNPYAKTEQYYKVSSDRLINSILLGIVTYDANLLVIHPDKTKNE